jgi:hypothetical protein
MKFFLVLKRGLSKSCPRVHDFLCTKPNLAQKQEENSVSHDLVDELQEIENMVLNPNINVENLVEEASNGTVIYNI